MSTAILYAAVAIFEDILDSCKDWEKIRIIFTRYLFRTHTGYLIPLGESKNRTYRLYERHYQPHTRHVVCVQQGGFFYLLCRSICFPAWSPFWKRATFRTLQQLDNIHINEITVDYDTNDTNDMSFVYDSIVPTMHWNTIFNDLKLPQNMDTV